MKKLIIYINETFEEEKALVDLATMKILEKGDYYHDKIDVKIEGLLKGFELAGIDYKVDEEIINPQHTMFDKLEFYADC